MKYEIENKILTFIKKDLRREYTIPEIMIAVSVKNREKVVAALARLEGQNNVEISREKGRTKYYRISVKG